MQETMIRQGRRISDIEKKSEALARKARYESNLKYTSRHPTMIRIRLLNLPAIRTRQTTAIAEVATARRWIGNGNPRRRSTTQCRIVKWTTTSSRTCRPPSPPSTP